MAEIRIENLHKRFGDFVAVKDSTLTIRDGDFFVLLGPSGCGKTTTLRMIAGLEMPSAGKIYLDGEDVTGLRAAKRDIAFVFQLFALYPHMNVRQNLAFPLKSQGMPRSQVKERVTEVARMLRIDHLLDRKTSGLSGGDRQRVALGRAIVRRPKAFLMDEPLGALDAEFRELMCDELRTLHERIEATTVYVTHDQLEAMAMADRIAVMNDGVIEQIGPPFEIYNRPRSLFVADFIGSPPMNLIRLRARLSPGDAAVRFGDSELRIPRLREGTAQDGAVLGVRPEHIRLHDQGPIRARIYGVEFMGTTQIVTLDTPEGQIKARLDADQALREGEAVGVSFLTDRLVVFDGRSGRALDSDAWRDARKEGVGG